MNGCGCQDQARLLQDINVLDFTVTELREYLDTHPYDTEAIAYFHRYVQMLQQAKQDYTMKYTPIDENNPGPCMEKWKWALDKMPWERGF